MTRGCLLLSSGGVIYSVIVINNITDTCCTAQASLIQLLALTVCLSHTPLPSLYLQ